MGCSTKNEKSDRIVIWTNNSEFIQYIELFNKTHKSKIILVYKENPAASLPAKSEEIKPDIVVAPYLRNRKTTKNFESIDYLFDRNYLEQSDFYFGLLKAGKFYNKYYLLPVSFNLPTIIFSTDNSKLIENDYTISPEELYKIGKKFDKRNKKNKLTQIGFSPLSSDDFLYTFSRMNNVQYKESKKQFFSFNQKNLDYSIEQLVKMTSMGLESVEESNDFVYKYLSVVDTKRVTSERTLFAYTTSDEFLKLPGEQISKIDFRWLESNGLIPVEDSMVMMGISKDASNYSGAIEFITWFYNSETQRKFLNLKDKLTSDMINFGIAGGFSAVKDVNLKILPTYYKNLLSNVPQEGSLRIPDAKPANWEEIKETVIIPYIKESILLSEVEKVDGKEEYSVKINSVKSIEERLKRVFRF